MPLDTYGALKTEVAEWLERTDLDARIPTFIEMAEQRIFRELRTPNNEVVMNISWDYAAPFQIELPADYMEAKTASWNGVPMDRISDREFLALPARTGTPDRFARIADRIFIYPAPPYDSAAPTDPEKSPGGTFDLIYWADFSGLGQGAAGDADTNSVLRIAGGLYLFGALSEGCSFLMEDQRVALWEAKFTQLMSSLNREARRAELSGAPMSMRR